MRIKGISWIEQHFEKIVAGIFGASMLGVLAWQFAGPQATVKVGSKEVPLVLATDEVASAAKASKGRIETSEPAKVEGQEALLAPLANATQAMARPISPSSTLEAPLGAGVSIDGGAVIRGGATGSTIAQFAGLKAPAPSKPVAQSHGSSISPLEAKVPEVAAVLPKAAPYDKFSVTIEFPYPGTVLRDVLATDPDGDGPLAAMPKLLWDGGVQILQTEIERQELSEDGQWINSTIVKPIPGRFSIADRLAQPISGSGALKELIKQATDRSADIRRPTYYAALQGPDWKPPTERTIVDDADKKREIANLRRQFTERLKSRNAAQEELEKIPAAPAPGNDRPDPRTPAPAPRPGGGGTTPGGGGGGGRPTPPGRAPNTPAPSNPAQDALKRKNLERKIEAENRAMEQLQQRLVALGDDVKDLVPADPNVQVPQGTDTAKKSDGPLLEDASARLWAHDVFAERGKTYRYRARVVLSNPLFMQFTQVAESQADIAKSPTFRSEYSEWSEPVSVEREQYFFVTGANIPDSVDRTAGARVEMFVFSWGYWRRAASRLEPGDRVQGIARGVPDFSAIAKQLADGGAANPTDPRAPAPGTGDPAKPNVPVADLPVTIDVTLLNVSTDPADSVAAAGRSRLTTYFRDAVGHILSRSPEGEQDVSLLLRTLRASAEEGLLALKPKAVVGDGGQVPDGGRDVMPAAPVGGGGGVGGRVPPPAGGG